MPAGSCAHCQQELRPGARSDSRYCSGRCRVAAHRARRSAPPPPGRCAVCASPLPPPRHGPRRRYCSAACREAARLRRLRGVPEWLPKGSRGPRPLGPPDVARAVRHRLIEMARRRQRPGSGSDLAQLEQQRRPTLIWWEDADRALEGIPHAVVGGVASNAYMAPRFTVDLDLAVAAEHLEEAERRLAAAGWVRQGDLDLNADPQLTGGAWLRREDETLDLLSLHHRWAEAALTGATGNRPDRLPILPLPYLVLLKLSASRAPDVADLSRMLGRAGEAEYRAVEAAVQRFRPGDLEDVVQLRDLGLLERGELPASVEQRKQPLGPALVAPVVVAQSADQRPLLDVDPVGDPGQPGRQQRQQAGPVPEGDGEPDQRQQEPGVGGVADVAVGPGGDQPVVVLDGDHAPEEAAQLEDGPDPEHEPHAHHEQADPEVEVLGAGQAADAEPGQAAGQE